MAGRVQLHATASVATARHGLAERQCVRRRGRSIETLCTSLPRRGGCARIALRNACAHRAGTSFGGARAVRKGTNPMSSHWRLAARRPRGATVRQRHHQRLCPHMRPRQHHDRRPRPRARPRRPDGIAHARADAAALRHPRHLHAVARARRHREQLRHRRAASPSPPHLRRRSASLAETRRRSGGWHGRQRHWPGIDVHVRLRISRRFASRARASPKESETHALLRDPR